MRRHRSVAALALLFVLATSAGCGGSHRRSTAARALSANLTGGETVRTADCNQWTRLDPAGRQRLVEGMRTFFGGQTDAPGLRGQVLPDERAIALFDGYCGQPFAGGFKLYKIYGSAAAFTPPP